MNFHVTNVANLCVIWMKGLFHKFPSVLYFSYRIFFFFFFFFFWGGGHKIEVLASGIIKPLHATAVGGHQSQ